jgi:hypothetical protein
MSSWHEFGAHHGFEAALKARGHDAVYREVEIGRESLWCDDRACYHRLERTIIGQTFQGGESLEQLWCRGQVESLLLSGQVRRTAVNIGHGPYADKMAEANSAALNAKLTHFAMTAGVSDSSGGRQDDGDITWHEPLDLLSAAEAQGDASASAVLAPGNAPLEVGYTLPSRTLTHLLEEGAVWRWPYNSQRLWLLAAVMEDSHGWHVHPFMLDVDPTQYVPEPAAGEPPQ